MSRRGKPGSFGTLELLPQEGSHLVETGLGKKYCPAFAQKAEKLKIFFGVNKDWLAGGLLSSDHVCSAFSVILPIDCVRFLHLFCSK